MKKIKNLSESSFLKLFFLFISLSFIVAAFFMEDRAQMLPGMKEIMFSTCKVSTNYFGIGFSATFLNMGIVGLFCTALCFLPGAKANNATNLAVLLTIGFASWGMNIINMIPTMLGVCLYCLVKREKLGSQINAMMFSTGIAPLISDLLFRYPNAAEVGFNWLGLGLAIFVGLIIGFFLPAGLAHSPAVHKGYDQYSAALPIGMTAFFLRAVLYTVMGVELPSAVSYGANSWIVINVFCCIVFAFCIVFAVLLGCKPKDYWALLKDPGQGVSFTSKYGNAAFLMNAGIFGLFILAYFNLTGGPATGMTLGIVFCMLATCNSGSHPGNVWPIMVGYVLCSTLFGWLFNLLGVGDSYTLGIGAQGIMIGMCYANGLSPIAGKYGFGIGILAGALHCLLVTAVPSMHGGFCLYNGGFTAALICLMFVPQLEKFCKTKEERKLAKAAK